MGLTPIDESDNPATTGEESGDSTGTDSLLARTRNRARAAMSAVAATLLDWFGAPGPDRDRDGRTGSIRVDGGGNTGGLLGDTPADGDASDAPADVDLSDTAVDPPDCPSIDGLPPREQPLTFPTRNRSDDNAVDLAVDRRDDTLALSVPGEPDTTITSDAWEQVER